ncbi:MAG TPA: ABC transporter substrate-binding protein/permease [Candidatus Bathyarchaeia archaeon]|nr:ABC transporter substrate-binding protein/permease [Candidatus Bathyarchaeia archaeon]
MRRRAAAPGFLIFALLFVAVALSAPGRARIALADARPAAPPSAADDSLARVRARGELRWGADPQGGAPYVFQDPMDPNHLIGFEVDLAGEIAGKLGVKARPVAGQWENLLDLLDRGDFDVALNGIEVADEKLRVCALSTPYYVAPERLAIRKGDGNAPRSLEALRGRPVGTLPGSLAERILVRAGAEVRTYEGGQDEIYSDLELGRTDAVLLDAPIARYYGEVEPGLEVLGGTFGEVRYAIALRKQDVALQTAIDRALADLAREGRLRAIYQSWGLWNVETAALLGDPQPAQAPYAPAFETWRAAVGKMPPLLERLRDRYPATFALFARGALLTVVVSVVAMALAVPIGVLLALSRKYGPRPLAWLAIGYIEFFRGTPLLVQLIMIYFGLPELGVRLDPFVAGTLALGLNYAAAEAENYRAGLESVPVGQLEASWALGLSTRQALRWVVAPQALRIAIPPATNDFIALLKDSSLVSLVTLTELTKTYLNLASAMRDHLGLGLVVAAWYLIVSLPFAYLARRVEAALGRHLRAAGT